MKDILKELPEDSELVEKLQKGDTAAFDGIYSRYAGRLYSFGLKYVRSKTEAEELVQSVFMKVWENYKILRKESSFKSFLFTIAHNDICKLFRKRNYLQKFISDTIAENPQSSYEIEKGIDYQ